jgi:RNA polymerase sporulation-specific sigma factor
MPSSLQTMQLLEKAAKGDDSAKSLIVEENLGLVHAAARRFLGRGIEYDDLFQAGCIGLIKSVSAFDCGRGVQFSTYAVPVIFGEMRRMFRDDGTVKVSRGIKELYIRAMREKQHLSASLGREPQLSEIADVLKVDIAELSEALTAASTPMSLTQSDDDNEQQISIPVEFPEGEIIDKMTLYGAVEKLEEEDRQIILLRFIKNRTQQQTAAQLGMTQVQVSRRERKILALLRNRLTG